MYHQAKSLSFAKKTEQRRIAHERYKTGNEQHSKHVSRLISKNTLRKVDSIRCGGSGSGRLFLRTLCFSRIRRRRGRAGRCFEFDGRLYQLYLPSIPRRKIALRLQYFGNKHTYMPIGLPGRSFHVAGQNERFKYLRNI